MAVRTTSNLVKGILLGNYNGKTNPDLTPFMTAASAIVDRLAAAATEAGDPVSTTNQELVERWLSAYVYVHGPDPTYKSKSTGGASGSFNTDGTEYLNMAIMLDSSGLLETVMAKETASATWVGLTGSEALDIDDRD